MEFQHLVTNPVSVRSYEAGGEADFTARLAAATGCVFDRKAMTIDLVAAGREYRHAFSRAAEFEAALAAVRRAGVPLAGHAAVVGSLGITVLAGLALILVLWLLQGSIL